MIVLLIRSKAKSRFQPSTNSICDSHGSKPNVRVIPRLFHLSDIVF